MQYCIIYDYNFAMCSFTLYCIVSIFEVVTCHKRYFSFLRRIELCAWHKVYLFERESFRTLNFNWETFIHGRKGLFPLTFNCNSPWYWNRLTLVSKIKNTNMRSGEMFAYQQFSQCLIPRPCWSWTMNIICLVKENKNQSCYWLNELNIHISYNICILKAVFNIEYYYAFHIFSLHIRFPTIWHIARISFDCQSETLPTELCELANLLSLKDVCKLNYVSNFFNMQYLVNWCKASNEINCVCSLF